VNMQRPRPKLANSDAVGREMLILVDEQNRRIGAAEKLDAHLRGLLHRAFSIFLVDGKGRLLIQKRFSGKYHSGDLWANTCCGHPRPGERTRVAAVRRLDEELGLYADLKLAFRARYEAPLDHGLTENELVYVYFGRLEGEAVLNPLEVSETQLMPLTDLIADARANPASYAYWLRHYLEHHAAEIRRAITPYATNS
jgi:isopentenyl-diphosphate Delta-isomerase